MSKLLTARRKRALGGEAASAVQAQPELPAPQQVSPQLLSVLACMRCSVSSLAERAHSLPRRFVGSQDSVAQLAGGLASARRDTCGDCGVLASQLCKASEATAEEARVRAAQLNAYAMLLEREAEAGEESGVAGAARALLACSVDAITSIVAITWYSKRLWHALEASVRVRDEIDPYLCTVTGPGLNTYHAGDVDNFLNVAVMDAAGHMVQSIEADDVTLSLSFEGASVTQVAVGPKGAGVVSVAYTMPVGCVEAVKIGVTVCGTALPYFPCTVNSSLGNSAILTQVASKRAAAFLRTLPTWLPRRAYELLYRGSRDGMTAAAFHSRCDDKGPTLVLIRCDKGWVFGGHAGASWESDPEGKEVASPDAFLLSVAGPHSPGPVRFPILAARAAQAQWCRSCFGPMFNGSLFLKAPGWPPSPSAPFDEGPYCIMETGIHYEDVLDKGDESFTGTGSFTPVEVEVFAVTRV